MRVTSAVARKHRYKKILKAVKGSRGRAKSCIKIAMNRYDKDLRNQYISRKLIKRDMRSIWIKRISFALKGIGLSYSKYIIPIITLTGMNRKMISEMIFNNIDQFNQIVKTLQPNTQTNN